MCALIDASAPNLQQFMQSQVWPALVTPMELVWQRVGMYPSITRCSVEGLQDSNQLSIRQTVNRPSHLSTSSLSITLQARGRAETRQSRIDALLSVFYSRYWHVGKIWKQTCSEYHNICIFFTPLILRCVPYNL